MAVPALSGQDADRTHSRVLTWFAGRWRNHQPKRAEKPHSKSSGRKALDGPAARPETPLAVENSVGKPAAPLRRVRPMSARERERGELPLPYEPLEAKPPRVLFLPKSLIRKPSPNEKSKVFQGKFVDLRDLGWFNFRLILLRRFMWLKG